MTNTERKKILLVVALRIFPEKMEIFQYYIEYNLRVKSGGRTGISEAALSYSLQNIGLSIVAEALSHSAHSLSHAPFPLKRAGFVASFQYGRNSPEYAAESDFGIIQPKKATGKPGRRRLVIPLVLLECRGKAHFPRSVKKPPNPAKAPK